MHYKCTGIRVRVSNCTKDLLIVKFVKKYFSRKKRNNNNKLLLWKQNFIATIKLPFSE